MSGPLPSPFDNRVAVIDCASAAYAEEPPFHPHEPYPESPFPRHPLSAAPNPAYHGLRQALALLGLDAAHFGRGEWNPLGDLIRPGERVLLKPNYVQHVNYSEQDYNSVVVHSSLLRAAIDYVLIANRRQGEILIADAPLWDADFAEIARRMRLHELLSFYRAEGIEIGLLDLRRLTVVQRHGLVTERRIDAEQEAQSRIIDLGAESELTDFEAYASRLNGMDYDRLTTARHHSGGHHEYCVSQRVLDADVVINLPKLKTHKKAGVTLAMKNLVGINVDKNFLPHYRIGMPSEGGDEYPEVRSWRRLNHRLLRWGIDRLLMRGERWAVPLLRPFFWAFGAFHRRWQRARPEAKLGSDHPGFNQMVINAVYRLLLGREIRAGNWEGNDTIWRMILDLNRILLYADRQGRLMPQPQRRTLTILDGIIGGEKDGPMNPTPVASQTLLCGFNPVHVDQAAVQLMGFRAAAVKTLVHAGRRPTYPLRRESGPAILSNRPAWNGGIAAADSLHFAPHPAWPSLAQPRSSEERR